MNAHKEILLFLKGKSEKGLEIISNIFYKELNSSYFSILKPFEEDLFMEVIEKIFLKREFIIEKFKNEEFGLPSYIREIIKNIFKDQLLKMSKNPLNNVNIYEEVNLQSNKENPEKILEHIEALKIRKTLEEKLSLKEFVILCYIVARKEEKTLFEVDFFKDLSKDALYKRVQRLKEKLAKIVKEYSFSEGSFMFFLENFLPKICKRVKNERN